MPAKDADAAQRLKTLEDGHKLLVDQMADLAVEHEAFENDMTHRLEEAIGVAFDKAIDRFFERAQKRAAERTGMWVLGFIKDVLTRWLVVGGVLLVVGKVAGIKAAVDLWNAITGGGK